MSVRRYLIAVSGMLLGIVSMHDVAAAELVMFESAGCIWCATWNREVGVIYDKTAEARIAPLRRVDIDGPRPADLVGVGAIIYTPTFVLIDEGREIGRILGYPGEANFWGLLGVELKKLGKS